MKPLYFILAILVFVFSCATKNEIIVFSENGKSGLKQSSGAILLNAEYDVITPLQDSKYFVVTTGSYDRIYSAKTNTLSTQEYYYLNKIEGLNLLRVSTGGQYSSIINLDGEQVSPQSYSQISSFSNGLMKVRDREKFGMLNSKGEMVIPLEYTIISYYYKNNKIPVFKDGNWGIVNSKNEEILPFEYSSIYYEYWNKHFIVKKDGLYGVLNEKFDVIVPFEYIYISPYREGVFAAVNKDEKLGYITKDNVVVIPFEYEFGRSYYSAESFKNGTVRIWKNGKQGLINKQNEVLIPFEFSDIDSFSDGIACVKNFSDPKQDSLIQFGYIDSTGKGELIDYVSYSPAYWKVPFVPKELPDSLTYYFQREEVFVEEKIVQLGGSVYEDGADEYYTEYEELIIEEHYDTIYRKYSLDTLVQIGLSYFINAVQDESWVSSLKEVACSRGIMIGGQQYPEPYCEDQEGWSIFKDKAIVILGNRLMREACLKWLLPQYKEAFTKLHPYHKEIYKDIALNMKNYVANYNYDSTVVYYNDDVNNGFFAYKSINGVYEPYRKLHAFYDRLLIKHKAFSLEEGKEIVTLIADEVLSW